MLLWSLSSEVCTGWAGWHSSRFLGDERDLRVIFALGFPNHDQKIISPLKFQTSGPNYSTQSWERWGRKCNEMKRRHVEILWSSWIHLTHLSSGGLVHFASGGDGEMGWVFPAEVFPSLPHSTQQSSVSRMFSFSWIFFYEFMFGAWDERVVSTAGLVPQHLVLESLQETKHDLCCGWAQNRNRVAPVMFDVFWCCFCIEWSEVFDIVQDLFWSLFQMWFCDVSCAFPLSN